MLWTLLSETFLWDLSLLRLQVKNNIEQCKNWTQQNSHNSKAQCLLNRLNSLATIWWQSAEAQWWNVGRIWFVFLLLRLSLVRSTNASSLTLPVSVAVKRLSVSKAVSFLTIFLYVACLWTPARNKIYLPAHINGPLSLTISCNGSA